MWWWGGGRNENLINLVCCYFELLLFGVHETATHVLHITEPY